MASETSRMIQRFLTSIGEDIKSYRQLAKLLQEQKSLYLCFDAAKLNQNLAQQKPLLNKLGQHAKERSQTMTALRLTRDQGGMNKLFSALPTSLSNKVHSQWRELESLVKHCQALNQENGQSSASFHELMCHITQPRQHTYEEQPLLK
ncbi:MULTISPECIES: flagellar protein FlgN [Vibrio]|uniref:Flagellar protein FlgN n=1 Tax=Vibrio neptunius TaxID=170651 RepID=A0ABS3A970_9VIBR|nr:MULTISPECIES: flagellar protein FlgN [Vibrio]MBN3495034.1 flagellar protein FlgN [Vibrio neptunius]MBN3517439.1 flagellar protein FlgN [Vibrio neptunius]MBN3551387.1 flagellar protein FlgN [Vibrio neptunius]MBN3579833.1 flagellar protein FlgN [Vibrio neptunius]MCH9873499.1 flagellar protein FlgN [Vibrio neptunius]